jgi:hypothetical protein
VCVHDCDHMYGCLGPDGKNMWCLCVFKCVCARRALRVRKKTGGENMPVQVIGDILASELAHLQPYIRFCSCQLNGAALLQSRTDNQQDFKDFLKVRGEASEKRGRLGGREHERTCSE